jgi:hypothetical protein
MIETPLDRAKGLIVHPDLCLSTQQVRVLLRQLVAEIEARDRAVAEACIGEYGDAALIAHIKALIKKYVEAQ